MSSPFSPENIFKRILEEFYENNNNKKTLKNSRSLVCEGMYSHHVTCLGQRLLAWHLERLMTLIFFSAEDLFRKWGHEQIQNKHCG